MESGTVGCVAAAAGRPFLAIRAIADTATTHVPASALLAMDERGRWTPARFAQSLLSRPWDVPSLLRLGREFRAARLALARVVATIGTELCFFTAP